MKKSVIILVSALVVISVLASSYVTYRVFSTMHDSKLADSVEALMNDEDNTNQYYQTMGYCDGVLTYACKVSYTSEACRRRQCRV